MRRLLSNFVSGSPGAGLLVIRVAFGANLIAQAIIGLPRTSGLETDLAYTASALLGVLLLAGLWTQMTGALVAILALCNGLAHRTDTWQSLLLGAVGVALALIGPGAWSIDARLFGWKRIEIPHRKPPKAPPF